MEVLREREMSPQLRLKIATNNSRFDVALQRKGKKGESSSSAGSSPNRQRRALCCCQKSKTEVTLATTCNRAVGDMMDGFALSPLDQSKQDTEEESKQSAARQPKVEQHPTGCLLRLQPIFFGLHGVLSAGASISLATFNADKAHRYWP